MNRPSLLQPEDFEGNPRFARTLLEYYEDEDEAVYDDGEDEDITTPHPARHMAGTGPSPVKQSLGR
jgi:hypothetical protein